MPAVAEPPPPAEAPAAHAETEYQQLIDAALNEYERGSWEESAALFRRAHELRPSARTLRGLGMTAYEARRYPDSIRYLSESVTDTRQPLTEKQRSEATATIERAKLFVGHLQLRVDPGSAQVLINGQPRVLHASNSDDLITDLGWLEIEVKADGYREVTRRLRMNAGDRQQLTVHLERDAVTPVSPETVTLGSAVAASPESSRDSAFGTWKWVGAGAAVAAVGAGTALLVAQKLEAPSYNAECVDTTTPKPDCARRMRLLGKTLWTGSIVGFSLGAALAALSATLFVLDASSSDERPPALACSGAGELGVACRLQF